MCTLKVVCPSVHACVHDIEGQNNIESGWAIILEAKAADGL